jgi:protein TonB
VASQPVQEKVIEPQPAKPKEEKIQQEPIKAPSLAGAITRIKPNYLKNPAPVYPLESRSAKQEGLVVLSVDVDRRGRPMIIRVERSSGHDLLDRAAVKAVRGWTFAPARMGELAIESNVEIPVRFELEKY